MLNIQNITIKNFLSIGNVTQTISFTDTNLAIVLGENLDLGGNDSRNGVGKTAIANALSYALYGEALVRIKKDNLINKTNTKNMLVTLDFEKGGIKYRIERGRKPAVFKFLINGKIYGDTDTDEAQGESRITQQEIEKVLQISSDMFRQIICLNTYNEPYLAMRTAEQRQIIEQLLGITTLTEKALLLKEQIKKTKDEIKLEETNINSIKNSNSIIQANITSLITKSDKWQSNKDALISKYQDKILELDGVNIDDELEKHRNNATNKEINKELDSVKRDKQTLLTEIKQYEKTLASVNLYLTSASTKICPVCTQEMDKHNHAKVFAEYTQQKLVLENNIETRKQKVNQFDELLSLCVPSPIVSTCYATVEEVYNHKAVLTELCNTLVREMESVNPYLDQITILEKEGLKEVSYDLVEELMLLLEHQEFLYKLLTDKDSFIRKKIIDQSIVFLNKRLGYYLEKLALPHLVKFKSDLDVEITNFGKDFDFDNLSRGERTRLILSLSWAFRDIYENLNNKINICFIDELIDNGLDLAGVESSLEILKKMSREQHRNIFLISHRDELASRVNNVLKVTKENGFTTFEQLTE